MWAVLQSDPGSTQAGQDDGQRTRTQQCRFQLPAMGREGGKESPPITCVSCTQGDRRPWELRGGGLAGSQATYRTGLGKSTGTRRTFWGEIKIQARSRHMSTEHLLCVGSDVGAWGWGRWAPALPHHPAAGARGSRRRESLRTDSGSALLPGITASPWAADFFLLSLLPLTRHLGLRSRVTHWLMNSPPDVGYWNARLSTQFKAHATTDPAPTLGRGHHMKSLPPASSLQKQSPMQPPDRGWKRTGGWKVKTADDGPKNTGYV